MPVPAYGSGSQSQDARKRLAKALEAIGDLTGIVYDYKEIMAQTGSD